MILWFAGASFVLVWAVFKSPVLDYRLVMVGAVLPVGEGLVGGPWVLHTLLFGVVVLAVVMLATRRRRLLRRRWIGLPIGLLLHLVLDGTFARRGLFWWPVGGGALGGGMPELDRGWGMVLLLDLVGAACLVWSWRRFGFDDPRRRREFVRTGHLDRRLAGGPPEQVA